MLCAWARPIPVGPHATLQPPSLRTIPSWRCEGRRHQMLSAEVLASMIGFYRSRGVVLRGLCSFGNAVCAGDTPVCLSVCLSQLVTISKPAGCTDLGLLSKGLDQSRYGHAFIAVQPVCAGVYTMSIRHPATYTELCCEALSNTSLQVYTVQASPLGC